MTGKRPFRTSFLENTAFKRKHYTIYDDIITHINYEVPYSYQIKSSTVIIFGQWHCGDFLLLLFHSPKLSGSCMRLWFLLLET